MKIINLLPKEEQREISLDLVYRQLVQFWIWAIGSLAVFILLCYACEFYLKHLISNTQDQIIANQNLLNSSDYKKLQDEVLALNRSIKEINNYKSNHLYWSQAVLSLAELTPTDIQLNQVTIDAATGKVDIAGQALNRESIITLWSSILRSDIFRNINFPLTNLEKAKNANFKFTFYVKKEKISQP